MEVFLERFTQMAIVEVGVYLGGENTLMAQQFLHLTDIGSPLQQMCSKGVSEGVRTHLLGDSRTQSCLLNDCKDHHTGQRFGLGTIV